MNDFVEYVLDRLSSFGRMRARAMFGGHGIYKDDLIIGIIVDGELYFKVSPETRLDYEAYGSRPFSYEKDGKTVAMSYFLVPEEVMEDDELLREFVMKAYRIKR